MRAEWRIRPIEDVLRDAPSAEQVWNDLLDLLMPDADDLTRCTPLLDALR